MQTLLLQSLIKKSMRIIYHLPALDGAALLNFNCHLLLTIA